MITAVPAQLTCPLDGAESECLALDRRMAEDIRVALDAGESEHVEDVLDMLAWIDERRAAAATCASMN
jgi:hypothetical protein